MNRLKTIPFFNFQDVLRYLSAIPNSFSVYEVPFPLWNHLDYLWGKNFIKLEHVDFMIFISLLWVRKTSLILFSILGIDADTLVYPEILKNLEAFRRKIS